MDDISFNKQSRRYNNEIAEYTSRISELNIAQKDFMRYQRNNLVLLQNLMSHYEKASAESKKGIISSIFPRKLEYDGKQYRTNILTRWLL